MNYTIHTFIHDLDEPSQQLMKGVLAKASISTDAGADHIVTKLTTPAVLAMLSLQEKELVLKLIGYGKERFAAKLTKNQRCQILALHRIGITRDALANMYGINRRTVTHIYNNVSDHYKEIREIERQMGEKAFRETFLPQEVIDRALLFRQQQEKKTEKNNPHADRKAGAHQVRGTNCETTHRVIIAWKEAGDRINEIDPIQVPGWYYNDLDGQFPDVWAFVDDKSRATSEACFRAMIKDITDK